MGLAGRGWAVLWMLPRERMRPRDARREWARDFELVRESTVATYVSGRTDAPLKGRLICVRCAACSGSSVEWDYVRGDVPGVCVCAGCVRSAESFAWPR